MALFQHSNNDILWHLCDISKHLEKLIIIYIYIYTIAIIIIITAIVITCNKKKKRSLWWCVYNKQRLLYFKFYILCTFFFLKCLVFKIHTPHLTITKLILLLCSYYLKISLSFNEWCVQELYRYIYIIVQEHIISNNFFIILVRA